MVELAAVYGSPRRKGNSAALLQHAIEGAREQGAQVKEVVLRNYNISPCLEIYGCKKDGNCVINDDFATVLDILESSKGILLASPIFFYGVSAHTKIFMDRCQSRWVRKYWIEKHPFGQKPTLRKGMFLSVGASDGKKLFDGALLSVRYFFDVLDTELSQTVLCRNVDQQGEIHKHPEYLREAFTAGSDLARTLLAGDSDGET